VLPGGVLRPEEVADKVVRAIRDNTFLIYTHEGHKETVIQRAADPEGAIDLFVLFQGALDSAFKGS
jgi:hypothetical protein